MDLTLYQYGYEKCLPLHSYGPAVRNHYLFHYVISGKGILSVDKVTYSREYEIHGGMGFLIEPGQINTYYADRADPWEYTWIEFDGMKVKEILETAGLSTESPVYYAQVRAGGKYVKGRTALSRHLPEKDFLSSYRPHVPDHGRSSFRFRCQAQIQNGKRTQFYTNEAITFISSNYSFPITVEDIASRLNLDRSYFGKIFKETMGQVASGVPDPVSYVKSGGVSENNRSLCKRHQY